MFGTDHMKLITSAVLILGFGIDGLVISYIEKNMPKGKFCIDLTGWQSLVRGTSD